MRLEEVRAVLRVIAFLEVHHSQVFSAQPSQNHSQVGPHFGSPAGNYATRTTTKEFLNCQSTAMVVGVGAFASKGSTYRTYTM